MSKNLRTAVIGTGFVGRVHVEAIRRLGFVDIAAIVDVNIAQAERYAQEFGAGKAVADYREVLTDPKEYDAVLAAIKASGITPEHSEVTMIASTYQKLEGTQATAMMRLLETLEDLDDTQNVYTNFDMDEAAVAAAG